MEGLLVEICPNETYDIVDTRNDQYGRLRMYYSKIKENLALNSTVSFDIKRSAAGNIYAKYIAAVERNTAIFNTEDRSQWYNWGENEENDFISYIVPHLNLDIQINPAKRTCSWAIDLIDYTRNRPADLKTQNTPFFTVAKYKYKGVTCNPTYSVTFNRKDYINYKSNYPNCDIYFWVHWTQTQYRNYTVPEIYGVWRGDFSKMALCIESGQAPLHPYMHRVDDDHNANDSYVFNLQDEDIFEKVY